METKSLASSGSEDDSCLSVPPRAATAPSGVGVLNKGGKRGCSTLPRKLNKSKVSSASAEKATVTKRSVDDFLMAVDKEARQDCLSDEGSSISGGGGGDLFDPDVLPTRISQLRQDLLSLINLDNELFKHLLTINDTLEELKEQRQGVDKSQLHRSITRYVLIKAGQRVPK